MNDLVVGDRAQYHHVGTVVHELYRDERYQYLFADKSFELIRSLRSDFWSYAYPVSSWPIAKQLHAARCLNEWERQKFVQVAQAFPQVVSASYKFLPLDQEMDCEDRGAIELALQPCYKLAPIFER
eukprot:EC720814.1.p2 GENE.EC720814.1~~EC720814.1.p2  ORF type:complete len:126 (-),score=0.55 EC720814.1:63-440(-)